MNHDTARNLLQDYLDGLLPAGRATDLEGHLRDCAECRRELEALRAILSAASRLPRRIEPERDLWPAIAARALDREEGSGRAAASAPAQGARAGAATDPRRAWRDAWRPWQSLWPVFAGTMAVVAIVLSSVLRNGGAPAAIPSFADALAAECSGPDRELAAYAPADSSGGALTDVISENLAIVDRAIADARQAYEANPDSPKLVRLLAAAYRARAALTTRAVEAAAESDHVAG